MTIPLLHVDAFTDRPFAGNPAAVCLLPMWNDDRWLAGVAGEMNLSETAFLVRNSDGFDLRWFTPLVEVDLCGHATLASAWVLFYELHVAGDRLTFNTKSGKLTVVKRGELLVLNFPARPPSPVQACAGLVDALGGKPENAAKPVRLSDEMPDTRTAIARSVQLLEQTSEQFFHKSGCFACHEQPAAEFAASAARARRRRNAFATTTPAEVRSGARDSPSVGC